MQLVLKIKNSNQIFPLKLLEFRYTKTINEYYTLLLVYFEISIFKYCRSEHSSQIYIYISEKNSQNGI